MKWTLTYITVILLLISVNNAVNMYINNKHKDIVLTKQYHFDLSTQHNDGPRIILLGSSTTKSSFDLDKLSDYCSCNRDQIVNLATIPNNPEITLTILREVKDLLPGSIVLYGVDPWILGSQYYQYFNYRLNTWNIQERLMYLKRPRLHLNQVFNCINGGNLVMSLIHVIKVSGTREAGEMDYPGSDQNALPVVADWFKFPPYQLSEDFMQALSCIDSLCYNNDSRLIAYYPGYGNEWTDQFAQLSFSSDIMKSIKKSFEFGKFEVLAESYPDSLFFDGIHVNGHGKEIKTRDLYAIIRRNNLVQ